MLAIYVIYAYCREFSHNNETKKDYLVETTRINKMVCCLHRINCEFLWD